MIDLYDCLGLVGVVIGISCYAAVQWRRDFAKHIAYSAGNGLSSTFMCLSLWHNWNLASFISNFTWVLLSLYGIYRCLKYKRKASEDSEA